MTVRKKIWATFMNIHGQDVVFDLNQITIFGALTQNDKTFVLVGVRGNGMKPPIQMSFDEFKNCVSIADIKWVQVEREGALACFDADAVTGYADVSLDKDELGYNTAIVFDSPFTLGVAEDVKEIKQKVDEALNS